MNFIEYFSTNYTLLISGIIPTFVVTVFGVKPFEKRLISFISSMESPALRLHNLNFAIRIITPCLRVSLFFLHVTWAVVVLISLIDTLWLRQPFLSSLSFMLMAGIYLHLICSAIFAIGYVGLNKIVINLKILSYLEYLKAFDHQRYREKIKRYQRKLSIVVEFLKTPILASLFILYFIFPAYGVRAFVIAQNISQQIETLGYRFKEYDYISYNPTNYNPRTCNLEKGIQAKFPLKTSVEKDLKVLYDFGFKGLMTFSSLGPNPKEEYIPPILYSLEFIELNLTPAQTAQLQKEYYTEYIAEDDFYSLRAVSSAERKVLVKFFRNKFVGLSDVPRLAKKIGFKTVILGLWNVETKRPILSSQQIMVNSEIARLEMNNAVSAQNYVDAYCVGHNELNNSYNIKELGEAIKTLRKKTGKPVTTTQPVMDYFANSELYELSDWLCPDIHGYWYTFIENLDNYDLDNLDDKKKLAESVSRNAGNEILQSVKQLQDQFLGKVKYNRF